MPFCAKCGTKLEDATGFCPKCGTATQNPAADIGDTITASLKMAGGELEKALKTAGDEIDKALREAKAELSGQEGSFCPKCGKKNPVGARFCVACGAEIPRVV